MFPTSPGEPTPGEILSLPLRQREWPASVCWRRERTGSRRPLSAGSKPLPPLTFPSPHRRGMTYLGRGCRTSPFDHRWRRYVPPPPFGPLLPRLTQRGIRPSPTSTSLQYTAYSDLSMYSPTVGEVDRPIGGSLLYLIYSLDIYRSNLIFVSMYREYV